jgi:hypothetical protein
LSREETIGPGWLLFYEDGSLHVTPGSLDEAFDPPYSLGRTLQIAQDGSKVVTTRFGDGPPHVVVMGLDGTILSEFDWDSAFAALPQYGVLWLTPDSLTVPLDGAEFAVSLTGEALGTIRFADNASRSFLNRSLEREVDQDGYRSLTMVDPWTGEVIADLGTGVVSHAGQDWSPDGRLFAFGVESGDRRQYERQYEDIYVVDDHGRGGRLTEFAARFTDFDIRMVVWSPEGRYIALWARTHPPSDVGLGERLDFFVFDVRSRTLVDFCLSRIFRYGVGMEFAAFWAPDSSSVIVPIFDDTPQLVIDIATGETREIPVGISVWAWAP